MTVRKSKRLPRRRRQRRYRHHHNQRENHRRKRRRGVFGPSERILEHGDERRIPPTQCLLDGADVDDVRHEHDERHGEIEGEGPDHAPREGEGGVRDFGGEVDDGVAAAGGL